MSGAEELTATMRRVEPNKIETELDNDWRSANAKALASGGQAGARTSVLTLVIYSDTNAQADRAIHAVRSLTGQHPSRCVVVAPQSAGQDGRPLDAFIRTYTEGAGGATSSGEEIVLRATPSAAEHLAGVILPLTISGLPAFLWWQGEPPWRTELFEATIDGFDRLLVDSCEMNKPDRALIALDDLIRRKKASCAITDFSFARLTPWRELIAQFFDGAETRGYLNGIDRLSIEYAASDPNQPSNAAQGYLLAGWLASRLGWTIVTGPSNRLLDGGGEHTLVDAAKRKISLEISPRYGIPLTPWFDLSDSDADGKAIGPGALMSVYLHSQVSGSPATFSVARETTDLRNASTSCHVPNVSTPSQTIHMPSLGEMASLSAELERVGHDVVFEESLVLAAQLLGAPATRSHS